MAKLNWEKHNRQRLKDDAIQSQKEIIGYDPSKHNQSLKMIKQSTVETLSTYIHSTFSERLLEKTKSVALPRQNGMAQLPRHLRRKK